MADEFDVGTGADDGTPDFDLPGSNVAPAKAEPEPKTIEQELESEFDKLGAGDVDADAKWAREHRRLADAAIAAAGVDPSERHAANMSRRETTRRLYRAEQMIRQDLGEGVSAIIQSYGAALPPEQRGAIGQRVLQSLGFQAPGQIAEQDRARLQQYDAQAAERRAHEAAMVPKVAAQVADFAARNPDYEQLRLTAASFIHTGAAHDLEGAFALARRASGQQDAAAKAADDARRSKVASARAAGTPQTKSAPGQRRADPTAPSRSTTELLEAAYDELIGA